MNLFLLNLAMEHSWFRNKFICTLNYMQQVKKCVKAVIILGACSMNPLILLFYFGYFI